MLNRTEIMEKVADYFGINNNYDIESYEWVSGCTMHGTDKWLTLGEVVQCIEGILDDIDPYDYIDYDEE